MPYRIKVQQVAVKNPDTGEYTGADILSEKTTQTTIREIQNAGEEVKEDVKDYVAAIHVTSDVKYAQTNSGTIIPTSGWTVNPTIESGKFLWTKVVTTYKDNEDNILGSTTSYSVSHAGMDGNGSVSKVNGKSPTNGEVTVYAGDIKMSSSDTSTITTALGNKQPKIMTSGLLKGNGTGTIQTATKGTDYGTIVIDITLSSWSNNTCTITNSDIIATGYTYIVGPTSDTKDAYTKAGIYADDITADSKIVFHRAKEPTGAVKARVIRMVSP